MKPQMRKYGVSALSTGLGAVGFIGPWYALDTAFRAGFDGIQYLPLRGWSKVDPASIGDFVLSYEDPWNKGSLLQAVGRTLGLLRDPAPTFLDWVLFGRKYAPEFPHAIKSVHRVEEGGALEIHPEFWDDPQQYVCFCRNGGHVCWDTLHVRRPHRETGLNPWVWEDLLMALPEGAISLIHVHPTREEISTFLRGEKLGLTEMLLLLREKAPNVPAILEAFPPLMLRKKPLVAWLSRLRLQTLNYLG
ncbi:MAG TPA: hypothetical protein PLT50_02180 [bacterium]|nr:hypothetical protein [bacterium]